MKEVADVLSIYLDAQPEKLCDRFKVGSENADPVPAICRFMRRIERLNDWWGAKMLGDVNGKACRSYRKKRRSRGGSRRDLEDLRAAIGHHAAKGYHREIVKITLPEKGEPRDKWLRRADAAKLIWTCWRYREMQKKSRRAGCLGMSLEVLLNTYGHHHPGYLSDAFEKIAMRESAGEQKAQISGAVSGAVIPLGRKNS